MTIEKSEKKKGIKRGWRNKLKKLPEEKGMACISENSAFDLDDSFSSDSSQGDDLGVGLCNSSGAKDDFRWSIKPDERISFSPHQRKPMKNFRFSTFDDEEMYISDEFKVADEIILENKIAHDRSDEFQVEDEAAEFEKEIIGRDVSKKSQRKDSTTSKTKKAKKKKSKVGSSEKKDASKLRSSSSKKTGSSSSKKSSKSKSRSLSKSLSASTKETSKKDKTKKKKKKSFRQSTDAGSGSGDPKMESVEPKDEGSADTILEDSVEETTACSDVASKPPSADSLLDQVDSLGDTEDTEATTEADDHVESLPQERKDSHNQKVLSPRLLSPRVSNRHSMLKNKIRASLASLGEQSAMSRTSGLSPNSHIWSPRQSARHSVLKNKIRASLMSLGERSSMSSAVYIQCGNGRSSEVSRNSHRCSQTPSESAFLDAFHTEDRDSVLGRLSVQDKDLMENLLNELHQYETQLEEERNEISKERCMMQLKQETVEQMLEAEMDKNLHLESQVVALQERLDHYETAKEDNELLQTVKMLETEVELLRQKTERQDQAMASMVMKAKQSEESHRDSSSVSIQKLPVKEQGELLMLRSAYEEQTKELAKMKEQIRSTETDQTVEKLKQAVKNAEQQKKYFMKEAERFKKLLGKQAKKSNTKQSKGWFGISENDECLLDLADTNMVFGSVSDFVVPENDHSSSWMENSSSWMAMSSETLQSVSSEDSLQADSCY